MHEDTFLKRIISGKGVSNVYRVEGKQGIICIWKYGDSVILTWEECEDGYQDDESLYTKDERHEFADTNALLDFMRTHSLSPRDFSP